MYEREKVGERERAHRRDAAWYRRSDPAPLGEAVVATPGKRTLLDGLARAPAIERDGTLVPGRRSLAEIDHAPVADPRPGFDDCRARALRELLGAIAHAPELHDATLAAADRDAARRAMPALSPVRPRGAETPAGRAMWRAAERRAVTLYRLAGDHHEVSPDDPAVAAALAQIGSGAPLPASALARLEQALDVPLGHVRVHTDAVAADAARALHARAFTVGEDIFFADGAFAPDSPDGERLLAHELAHVLQSRQGRAQHAGAGMRVSHPGDPLEREADSVAEAVAGRAAARRPQEARDRAPPGGGGLGAWSTIVAARPGGGLVQRMLSHDKAVAMAEPQAERKSEGGPLTEIDDLIHKAIGPLIPSLKEGQIASTLKLVIKPDEEVQREFWKQHPHRKGEKIGGFYLRDDLTIWLCESRAGDVATCIHECMHAYSHPATNGLGGGPVEGMTEYFARLVCKHHHVKESGAYRNQVTGIEQLIQIVGVRLVARAYFDGENHALIAAFPSTNHFSRWAAKLDPADGSPYADPALARVDLPRPAPAPAEPKPTTVGSQPMLDNASPSDTSPPDPSKLDTSKLDTSKLDTSKLDDKQSSVPTRNDAPQPPSELELTIDKAARKDQPMDNARIELLYTPQARKALTDALESRATRIAALKKPVDAALFIIAINSLAAPGFTTAFSSTAATGAALYFYDNMRDQKTKDARAQAVATLVEQFSLAEVLDAYLHGTTKLKEDRLVVEWVYQMDRRGFLGAETASDWEAVKREADRAL